MALVKSNQIVLSESSRIQDEALKRFLEQNFATIKAIFDGAGLGSGAYIPPTSSTGLPSGALWNNAGTLTIVP